ncbi:MAG: hypothetical protein IT381_07705 [Deltaproteobacteria bacterium]|nr:hypothetical protein [Deltaproteobacteria bacterium]
MVTIDVPACIALGAIVAIRHKKELPEQTPQLRLAAFMLVTFGFVPLGSAFDFYFHDWEWQYFFDRTEPVMSILFNVAMSAGGLLGFELARRAIMKGNEKGAMIVAGSALGFTALYSAVFFQRVLWVGTVAEWQSGTATFMLTHTRFMMLLAGTALYLTAWIYMLIVRPLTPSASRSAA